MRLPVDLGEVQRKRALLTHGFCQRTKRLVAHQGGSRRRVKENHLEPAANKKMQGEAVPVARTVRARNLAKFSFARPHSCPHSLPKSVKPGTLPTVAPGLL